LSKSIEALLRLHLFWEGRQGKRGKKKEGQVINARWKETHDLARDPDAENLHKEDDYVKKWQPSGKKDMSCTPLHAKEKRGRNRGEKKWPRLT